MVEIAIEGAAKAFRRGNTRTWALDDTNMTIGDGEIVGIVGPSGCGKSTLLNLLAGLQMPSRGRVVFGGQEIRGVNTAVGYMTQKDDLLPWRSLERNLALPLEITRVPRKQRHERIRRAVDLLGLSTFEHHYPAQLSGGMRKRVSLGRVLLARPEAFLLDEPFSALDAQRRQILQNELLSHIERLGSTTVLVTHDIVEAVTLSDRVAVMSAGPGRIKMIREVPLPRPRRVSREDLPPEAQSLLAELWDSLAEELAEV